jgi:hypothetical protein
MNKKHVEFELIFFKMLCFFNDGVFMIAMHNVF